MTDITTLRCETCGTHEIISIIPGSDSESVDLLGTRVVIRQGVPTRAFCLAHATWLRPVPQAEAAL